MKREEKDCFNAAFKGLKEKLENLQVEAEKPQPVPKEEPDEEFEAFLEAMDGVSPLPPEKKKTSRPWTARIKPAHPPPDDQKTALAHLHGLTRQQAEEAVKEFVYRSYRLGLRCILIIHGRGLNSPDSFPVLKEGLPLWLGRGKAGKLVLAFSTARPYDGGTGATYVLLRKR